MFLNIATHFQLFYVLLIFNKIRHILNGLFKIIASRLEPSEPPTFIPS
jgi:hypothetical protein